MATTPTKLTKSKIEALKPTAGVQSVVWDGDLKGFGIRLSAGGTKTFFVQGRIRGSAQVVKATIGQFGPFTAEQARDKARNMLNAMANGVDPRVTTEKREAGHTLGDLMTGYVEMLLPLTEN